MTRRRDCSDAHGADRIIDLYDRHAQRGDADRWRNLFERSWLGRFLALLPGGGSILDIGCGSGEPIARYFIEAGAPTDPRGFLAGHDRPVPEPLSSQGPVVGQFDFSPID